MAQLPDSTAIAPPSIGSSGRPIASFDATGYARGAAALGAGAEKLGQGIEKAAKDISVVDKQQQGDDNRLDVARFKATVIPQKVELDASLPSETDHETLPERYSAKLGEIIQTAAAQIKNPRTRELAVLSVADDVARGNAQADATANKLWADATIADTTTRLEAVRQGALTSTDPVERQRLIQTGNDLITSLADKGVITKESAVKTRQEWTTKYAAGAISMLPPEDRLRVLGGFEGSLVKMESGGKANLVNALGYAGLYQFGAPRLADMGVYKPGDNEDLKNWSKTPDNAPDKWSGTFDIPGHPEVRTLEQFLASPDAQRAAYGVHTAKMDQEIQSSGLDKYIGQTVGGTPITREGLYAMLHLGGVGGAKDALEGKGNAKDANGTSVLDYAKLGNQSDLTKIASLLPEDTRVRMRNEAQNEVDRGLAKTAAAQSETWERKIIDAGAGIATLPNRKDIETDPGLDEPRRNALLRQYDSAAGDVAGLQRFMAKFKDPNGGAFNPYDTEERKYVDKAFTALGSDVPALQAVVARTGIVPKAAAAQMRGSIVSNDPKRVADALTLSSNLINSNPNAFVGVDGQKDFENNAVAFRHYVDDLGMTAADAAKKIIQQQSPEYQAMKAKIKPEDIDAKIKKELSVGDLAHQFDQVPWIPFTDPKVGFDPKQRLEMYSQYAEGVKEHYLETGDWDIAKKQSANDLKKTWGVSSVNGSSTVMQYPPERAPAYAGIVDPAAAIAKQAVDAVKVESGTDIDRKSIHLQPVPGITAQAFKSGQPVPYMLMWNDKDGVVHMLNPGRAFVADPVQMKDAQSDQRRNALQKGEADAGPVLDMRAAHRAQLEASRRAMIGQDTSQELAAKTAPAANSTTPPRFTQIPADSPEARGLPGGADALKKNVSSVIGAIKSQPILPGDGL